VERRPVHLPDRRGGECLVLDVAEQLVEALVAVVRVEHLADLLPWHRRRRGSQPRELLLVDLAVLLGDEVGVYE
jgi:hypothetical protein